MLAGLLYERMRELGIRTEAELSARTGLSPSQVSRLLSGRIHDVPALTVVALAEHLDLDAGAIVYAAAGLARNRNGSRRYPGIEALLARHRAGRLYLTEREVEALLRYDGIECPTANAAMLLVYTWRVWAAQQGISEE
jgi:transcriptional regulator with XRE-family HTH domain